MNTGNRYQTPFVQILLHTDPRFASHTHGTQILTLLYMFPTVLQTDEYIWPSVSLNPAQPMSTRG